MKLLWFIGVTLFLAQSIAIVKAKPIENEANSTEIVKTLSFHRPTNYPRNTEHKSIFPDMPTTKYTSDYAKNDVSPGIQYANTSPHKSHLTHKYKPSSKANYYKKKYSKLSKEPKKAYKQQPVQYKKKTDYEMDSHYLDAGKPDSYRYQEETYAKQPTKSYQETKSVYSSPNSHPSGLYRDKIKNVKTTYSEPAYNKPTYNMPSYSEPAYNKPTYNMPSYSEPKYTKKYQSKSYQESKPINVNVNLNPKDYQSKPEAVEIHNHYVNLIQSEQNHTSYPATHYNKPKNYTNPIYSGKHYDSYPSKQYQQSMPIKHDIYLYSDTHNNDYPPRHYKDAKPYSDTHNYDYPPRHYKDAKPYSDTHEYSNYKLYDQYYPNYFTFINTTTTTTTTTTPPPPPLDEISNQEQYEKFIKEKGDDSPIKTQNDLKGLTGQELEKERQRLYEKYLKERDQA